MKIRRLSWAGIEITHGVRRLLIDPLENTEDLSAFLGSPRWPVIHVPVADGKHTDAALTHLHRDHYDPATLKRVLGQTGVVYCPEKVVEIVRSAGLRAEAVVTWQTVQLGGLQSTGEVMNRCLGWLVTEFSKSSTEATRSGTVADGESRRTSLHSNSQCCL